MIVAAIASRGDNYGGPINGDAETFEEFTAGFPKECVVAPQPQNESTAHNVYCKGKAIGIPRLPGQIVYQWGEQLPTEDLLTQWGSEACGLVSGRTVVDYFHPQHHSRSLSTALREFVNTVPATFKGEVEPTEACPSAGKP